jgi:hypothetical protein
MAYGAEGIGLLRSELFYISCAHLPSVQEEIDFYRKIIAITKRRPLPFVSLTWGRIKPCRFVSTFTEENPQLGNKRNPLPFSSSRPPQQPSHECPECLQTCHCKSCTAVCGHTGRPEKGNLSHPERMPQTAIEFEALSIGIWQKFHRLPVG